MKIKDIITESNDERYDDRNGEIRSITAYSFPSNFLIDNREAIRYLLSQPEKFSNRTRLVTQLASIFGIEPDVRIVRQLLIRELKRRGVRPKKAADIFQRLAESDSES